MNCLDQQDITQLRLSNQHITANAFDKPEDVVASIGAMQAQDYQAALWAIGLRCNEGMTKKDIENRIEARQIVRTWLMRGTLHFAHASDIRWLLKLFGPRLLSTAKLRDSHLGLTDKTVEKTMLLFENALKGNKQLQRKEMYEILSKGGVPSKNNLGYHMLYRAAWNGLICFGAHDGKQPTFALLDEWVRGGSVFSGDDALRELAIRYFTSHGPAMLEDYVWWSGLKVSDARKGIESAKQKLKKEEIDGRTYYMQKSIAKSKRDASLHLLPAFDEYLIGYRDRSAALDERYVKNAFDKGKIIYSNGIFLPIIVYEGKVIGTWKKQRMKDKIRIATTSFSKLTRDQEKGILEEAERYGRFLDSKVECKLSG